MLDLIFGLVAIHIVIFLYIVLTYIRHCNQTIHYSSLSRVIVYTHCILTEAIRLLQQKHFICTIGVLKSYFPRSMLDVKAKLILCLVWISTLYEWNINNTFYYLHLWLTQSLFKRTKMHYNFLFCFLSLWLYRMKKKKILKSWWTFVCVNAVLKAAEDLCTRFLSFLNIWYRLLIVELDAVNFIRLNE